MCSILIHWLFIIGLIILMLIAFEYVTPDNGSDC
jgi:hypothetical protein